MYNSFADLLFSTTPSLCCLQARVCHRMKSRLRQHVIVWIQCRDKKSSDLWSIPSASRSCLQHILLTTRTASLTSHHRRMVRERHANHFKRKSSSIPIQIFKWHHLSRSSLLLFFFYLHFLSLFFLFFLFFNIIIIVVVVIIVVAIETLFTQCSLFRANS